MIVLEHSRARVTFASRCWIAVVLLSICALTASLATRFTVVGTEVQKVTAVKFHSSDAYRQHLLSDGLIWTAPESSITLFQPPRSAVLMVSEVVPFTTRGSASWYYNRPPPSC